MTDIASWLVEKGLGKHVTAFRDNDIDFDVLASLGEDEMKELGLSMGDRKRLRLAIADITRASVDSAGSPSPAPSTEPVAERRQLTVVFVDLVDSTALSRALDPEDLRDAMRAYHNAVAEVIRADGGFVAKFMGDGVLAYFGYPQASEDAAERAVRASLRAVTAVKALPAARGHALVARAGVASGPVVVGDVMGEDIAREVNVVGETPNLAARLLALGPPGAVIVAGSTRRLIGELFTLDELGPQSVKGIAEPVLAFRVTGERQGLSRYEATRGAHQSTFVGRSQEVGLLLDRWEQAKAGDGQLVLLSGEAGIGKSRITETLWRSVVAEDHHRIRYQCTPQHANSPLYPAITQLAAVADLKPEDEPTARMAQIRGALPDVDDERAALVASLLGVPLPPGSPLENLTPARRRQLLLDAFSGQLAALCLQRPVLWVIEDAHWIDPTTEELVSQVVDKAAMQRLLVVVTHRPEYRPAWSSNPVVTQLALNRLSRTHAGVLIEALASNRTLPAEVMDYVAARADGVPLFMEELFQALRDSGTLKETETAYELARPLDGTAIPATLQDSLMARLDRLAPAKAVAQIGAAIGREFGQPLLASIAGMKPEALSEGLRQLLDAGLLFSRGAGPETTYIFKHALVQDAAYGSMLRQRRQEVHGRIAQLLSEPSTEARPELIAHHFEAAGNLSEAIEWLDKAGDVASKASANQEAIRLWRQALALLARDDTDSQRRNAEIKKKLAEAFIQVEGYGSATAKELGESALGTARNLVDVELYIRICTSFAPTLFARLDFDGAERQLEWITDEDLRATSPVAQTHFRCIRGVSHFHQGRFSQALSELSAVFGLENVIPQNDTAFGGGDVRIVARTYLVRASFFCGFGKKAMTLALETVALARSIDHPFSVSWALITLGRYLFYRGQYREAIAAFDESQDICMRYGYSARLANCLWGRGIALTALGEIVMGIEELDRGIELWSRAGGKFALDLMLVETAHTLMRRGDREIARRYVLQAGSHFASGSERAGYAEYLRLEGLLAAADGDREAAYKKLREAVDLAEAQTARLFHLRACHDLARLLAEDGKVEEARDVLGPTYAWFTEGFDAPDLVAAKTLLDQLTR
ncbi:MAG: AAA family ATPase [Alphaproteobacteria bacterium]|nr:AAA family ATPase [Alphaproteobacteria bacterium]